MKGAVPQAHCSKCGFEGTLVGPKYVPQRLDHGRFRRLDYLQWHCPTCGAAFRAKTLDQMREEVRQEERLARRLAARHNRWYRRLGRALADLIGFA